MLASTDNLFLTDKVDCARWDRCWEIARGHISVQNGLVFYTPKPFASKIYYFYVVLRCGSYRYTCNSGWSVR